MQPEEDEDLGSPFGFNVKAHHRGLEALFRAAPVNQIIDSSLSIKGEGEARIEFPVNPLLFHAAGGLHGIVHYKAMSDAAFYAANSLFTDRFLLTSSFNLTFIKPVDSGALIAEGRWVSGRKRILIADARLMTTDGEIVARGTGTFAPSALLLVSNKYYQAALSE
jgi:uncharacterized protein (TIGR00369 family)